MRSLVQPFSLSALVACGTLCAAWLLPPDDAAHHGRLTLQRAHHLTQESLASLERHQDECNVTASLAARATAQSLEADLALGVAACINEESATPQKFLRCLAEVFEEFLDGLELLELQHAARVELCARTGGGIYDPDLDEDEFRDGVDHTYFPFRTGATWVYQADTDEGLEEITVTVLDETLEIDEIECIVVRDVVTLDGVLIEDTTDWYAQHDDGSVWYMGEIAQNFEDGRLSDLGGSWEAGVDGALPGRVMLSQPTVGTTYRQELLLTEAEDAADILAVDATAVTAMGTYTGCLQTADYTPLEPTALEHKFYAPGIGLVLEIKPATGERLELISFTPGS